MEGYFSLHKSEIRFTVIVDDYALEQENKNINVLGVAKGLLQNKSALTRFVLIPPEMNRICDEFCN